MGLQRVRHDWATFTFRNILTELRKWQHPGRKMPRFLKSQRYGSKYWFYHLTCWGTTGKVLKLSELWFFPLVKYCLYPVFETFSTLSGTKQMLPSVSAGKNLSACSAEDRGLILGLGRDSPASPGEGNGNSFQYSCLENPMDRKPGGLQYMGSQRVGHDWTTKPPATNTTVRTR